MVLGRHPRVMLGHGGVLHGVYVTHRVLRLRHERRVAPHADGFLTVEHEGRSSGRRGRRR